jgi:ABC-type oligopeptide transport system substrate-binding subunit
MTNRVLLALTLLAVLAAAAAACAPSGYQPPPGEYYPYISDVPPSFYNYDPALRDWYTAPYWNPDIGP